MEKLIKTTHETIVCDSTVYFASLYHSREKIDQKDGRVRISINSEIEYKDTGIPVKGLENEFEYVLEEFGVKIIGQEDDEAPLQNLDEDRVSVDDFKKAIRNLERLIKKENRTKRLLSKDYLISCLGLEAEGLLSIMKEILEEADTRDGYIHFQYYEME